VCYNCIIDKRINCVSLLKSSRRKALKKLYIIVITASILFFSHSAVAKQTNNKGNLALHSTPKAINLDVKKEKQQKIELSEPVKELKGNVFESEEDMLKNYLQTQKQMDVEDITTLWNATVERNQVIRFALKKISLPASQRKINSSHMAKALSGLISGASLLPAFLGADPLSSSAASAGGTLANRALVQNSLPKELPLTDTELIQLARLIEDLQDKLIRNYYSYKSNLEGYQAATENVIKYNMQYSKALSGNDFLNIIASKALYDKAMMNEQDLRQKIKVSRLQLERLAGTEAVNSLKIGKIALFELTDNTQELNPVPLPVPTSKSHQAAITDDNSSTACLNTLADEIGVEMEEERQELLADLQVLWKAAMDNSETLKFAIYKLSNPQGEVAKKSTAKKILSPLASVAPIIGLGLGDPVTATSALFGGNLLNSAMADDNERLKEKLTRVTDTDLVLLAQETDTLQEKLIVLYNDYLNALMELNFVDKVVKENQQYFELAKRTNPEAGSVAAVFYQDMSDIQFRARQNVLEKRVALEQFVGNSALVAVDKSIKDRLSQKF